MYCSHNTACVQTYPDLLDVTATLDKEGAGKISASKGEGKRFFHTIKWQCGWWKSDIRPSFISLANSALP